MSELENKVRELEEKILYLEEKLERESCYLSLLHDCFNTLVQERHKDFFKADLKYFFLAYHIDNKQQEKLRKLILESHMDYRQNYPKKMDYNLYRKQFVEATNLENKIKVLGLSIDPEHIIKNLYDEIGTYIGKEDTNTEG